jgi:antitoxin ParD1/3/4
MLTRHIEAASPLAPISPATEAVLTITPPPWCSYLGDFVFHAEPDTRQIHCDVGERWEQFVDQAVKAGRYSSASEGVREGLRLVEEREATLTALRPIIDTSIAAGDAVTDAQLEAALAQRRRELAPRGIGA